MNVDIQLTVLAFDLYVDKSQFRDTRYGKWIMLKLKAINRKKLVAFVLPIIQKGADAYEWKTGKAEPLEIV